MPTLPTPRGNVEIGGIDLGAIGIFEDFGGIFSTRPRRGSGYQLPGVDNEITVTLPADSYEASCGVTLVSDEEDPDDALAEIAGAYAQLATVCETGSTVSVSRIVGSTVTGSAYAQNVRAEIQFLSSWHARVTISMRIVTGWATP